MDNVVWSNLWPTKPGFYLFFGHENEREPGDGPKFAFVTLKRESIGTYMVGNGRVWHESEVDGYFTPVKLPVAPDMGQDGTVFLKELVITEQQLIGDLTEWIGETDADELAAAYGYIFGMDGTTDGSGIFKFTPIEGQYAGQREKELR